MQRSALRESPPDITTRPDSPISRVGRAPIALTVATFLPQGGSNRMPSPSTDRPPVISTAAHAHGFIVALERICIADIARVPQDLDAGQQLDITSRAAGCYHADAVTLVGRAVFGPVLLQRVLRRGLVGETGFLVAPEHDAIASGGLATRPDLELGRAAGTSACDLHLGWSSLGRPPLACGIGGKITYGRLPMPNRSA